MDISLVLAMNPILAVAGPIAAFVICLFLLIGVILAVALNLGLAFGLSALRDKVELLKKVRPYVNTVNQDTRTAIDTNTVPSAESSSPVARAFATVPVKTNQADQKVKQVSERVANGVIEARARAEQAKMVARAFFLPGSLRSKVAGTVPAPSAGIATPSSSAPVPAAPLDRAASSVPAPQQAQEQVQVMRSSR